jgi:hypothetical protein
MADLTTDQSMLRTTCDHEPARSRTPAKPFTRTRGATRIGAGPCATSWCSVPWSWSLWRAENRGPGRTAKAEALRYRS